LLDLESYEKQFVEVYENLDKLKQEKVRFGIFDIEKVEKNWENIFIL
jgi:hypothetical protein